MFTSTSLDDVNRVEEVSRDQHQADEDENREDPEADGNQLTHVDQAGIRPPSQPGDGGAQPLVENHGDMPAVQWQQREQVEQADEDVQRGDDQDGEGDLLLPAEIR